MRPHLVVLYYGYWFSAWNYWKISSFSRSERRAVVQDALVAKEALREGRLLEMRQIRTKHNSPRDELEFWRLFAATHCAFEKARERLSCGCGARAEGQRRKPNSGCSRRSQVATGGWGSWVGLRLASCIMCFFFRYWEQKRILTIACVAHIRDRPTHLEPASFESLGSWSRSRSWSWSAETEGHTRATATAATRSPHIATRERALKSDEACGKKGVR